MPKYKVQVCYESLEYYDIEVDAENGGAAKNIACHIWRENPDQFNRREELDDANGISITECNEVEENATIMKQTAPC